MDVHGNHADINNELIEQCLLKDRHTLHRRFKSLSKRLQQKLPADQGFSRLQSAIHASMKTVALRQARLNISFPDELPINQERQNISALIASHQVVILCGETGSGKSTQLPKICLDMNRGVYGRIGHTQPRRLAARSLASRISQELDQPLGETVGYKVRFKEHVKPQTRVKLLTDGMLLAEIQQDKWLNEYDTLIIDEAHERSLNIDFLLGYLKSLVKRRRDLKIIVTSATIDPERFSRHFNDAPIINVSGRTYPVEVLYRPLEERADDGGDGMQQGIVEAIDEISRIDRGDILVFLSGEREIRETTETLRKHKLGLTEVLPLYARLSPSEQSKIFSASGKRRIILATNVAETSLTVPGIRYVIDTGLARISRYSHRAKVQRLPVERISQASANQRKGRCGRVASGVCIRLYSEDDFTARPEFTEPEILRTNLATVILQMKVLHFGNIENFPFVEKPEPRMIRDGYRVLHEIGAVDTDERITHLGKLIARLPVDPRFGRMLLEASQSGCLRETLVIISALSVQDPRDRPMDKQQLADEAHQEFREETSDFIGFYKLWQHLQEKRPHLSRRKFNHYCRQRFLSPTRVQEWVDIHHQIQLQMHDMGYRENEQPAQHDTIHQSLLTGLLSHLGCKTQGRERDYLGARNTHFHLFPGSVLFKQTPKWVMAAELVETSRLYARTVAQIDPRWIESYAGHLVKRHYSEPHWQKKRGQVAAYERVTLYGITIISGRKINYGPINPEEAREIFIRFALVEGDFETRAKFWRHNQELLEYVQDLEARSRRRDILVDPEVMFEFYDKRIPEGVYSKAQFESWLKKATVRQPRLLHMDQKDLMRHDAGQVTQDSFPDSVKLGEVMLPLEYHFDPKDEEDGVSLVVPVALINQVSDTQGDWLVPGLLKDKLIALLKSLPKQYRRQLVPIPDTVERLMPYLDSSSDTPLMQQVAAQIKKLTGTYIPEDQWHESSLDQHLHMTYRVVDADGTTLATGNELHLLQKQFSGQAQQQFVESTDTANTMTGCRDWQFGDIADHQVITQAGIQMTGYPALVDEGDSVGLKVLDSAATAEHMHMKGLLRLIKLQLPQDVRYLKKNLPNLDKMRLQYAKVPVKGGSKEQVRDLQDVLLDWILVRVFLDQAQLVRTERQFQQRLKDGKPALMSVANQSCEKLGQVLLEYQQLRKALSQVKQINWMASVADMKQQLDELVYQGFLEGMTEQRFKDYLRYLKAMQLRLDKLVHAAARDQKLMREMSDLQSRLLERQTLLRQKDRYDDRVEEIRWMLEELRISLFAQEIKTAYPVSVKRIEKRWKELGL
jgi:ATP-dependent helicase HrpA